MTMSNRPSGPSAAAKPPVEKIPQFTDAAGRVWNLQLTIGRAREIHSVTGIDFTNVHDGQVFIELGGNPETFAQVLWLLCEKQAAIHRPPVTPDDFADGLNGAALDAAREAILEATISFIQAPLRGAAETVIRKTLEAQSRAMEEIKGWAETAGDRMVAAAGVAAREAAEAHGQESPSSPPTSELT